MMTVPAFTVGMMMAFQMVAGKLSQSVLRIVGLWTQVRPASLVVKRLGEVMNAPTEPYTLQPQRHGQGLIEIEALAVASIPDGRSPSCGVGWWWSGAKPQRSWFDETPQPASVCGDSDAAEERDDLHHPCGSRAVVLD